MSSIRKSNECGGLPTIILIILGVILLVFLVRHVKRNPKRNTVPFAYKALYEGYEKGLTGLNAVLDSKPSTNSNLVFGAEALIANGNRGADLLKPDAIDGVILELDQLQKLGVQGVTVAIPYPLFIPRFPKSDEYLNFYKRVVSEVRKRHLKLDIEVSAAFSKTDFSSLNIDYSQLTVSNYNKENRDMAQVIIDELSPDYLNLGSEPDTLSNLLGLRELNDPTNYTAHIVSTLDGLQRGNTLVGAGGSSWLSTEFMRSLAQNTSVDFLSIHLYPLNKNTLENITETIELAKQNKKKLILDEAWLYKSLPKENVSNVAATADIFKRDLYSFWQPLDKQFLSILVKIAKTSDIEYISPFWSRNFFTYIEYNQQIDKLAYPQILKIYNLQLIKDMTAGNFSETGLFYKELISKQ